MEIRRTLQIVAFAAILLAEVRAIIIDATPEELALIDHMKANGALLRFTIGRQCPTCTRGAISTHNIPANGLILALPVKLGVPLPRLDHQGFASEYAHGLVQQIKLDPEFNATHGLYWSTLPAQGEIFAPETITDELMEMLQTPELVRLFSIQRQLAIDIYNGNSEWVDGNRDLKEAMTGDAALSLDEFLHVCGLVGTRDFVLSAPSVTEEGVTREPGFWMLPLADMANHADVPSAVRSDNGTHVMITAKRAIRRGEEVTNSYQEHVIDRNDMSLYMYGFIQEKNMDNLCAVDLPTYKPASPFESTKFDSYYYGPQGRYNTPDELLRLKELLQAAEDQTTEDEDEKLLAKGYSAKEWKVETVVRFRLGRKRALKKAIVTVEGELRLRAKIEGSSSSSLTAEEEGEEHHDEL